MRGGIVEPARGADEMTRDIAEKAAHFLVMLKYSRPVACDMAHEAVLLPHDNGTEHAPAYGSSYPRPDICLSKRRKRNLACAHTTARYVLRDALALLAGTHDNGDYYDAQLTIWNDLDSALGHLDHRRHNAEDAQAAALQSCDMVAQATSAALIAQTITEHRALVAKIEAITHDVRAALESLITRLSDADGTNQSAQLKIAS
jgi:hypothetical protein